MQSLERLAGAVMCDQDEAWSDKRNFSEAKIAELYDKALRKRERQAENEMSEEEVQKTARQAIEASLELADKVERA